VVLTCARAQLFSKKKARRFAGVKKNGTLRFGGLMFCFWFVGELDVYV